MFVLMLDRNATCSLSQVYDRITVGYMSRLGYFEDYVINREQKQTKEKLAMIRQRHVYGMAHMIWHIWYGTYGMAHEKEE